MPNNPVVSPLLLDIAGVFIFGLAGGLVAVRKGLDIFGVVGLACVTSLAGGIARDLLIGSSPPVGVSDWRLIVTATAAGLLAFCFTKSVSRLSRRISILDAAGLAIFAVGGAAKATETPGIPSVTVVLAGIITAIGGSVLRDILVNEVPHFLRREYYAVPAMLGAATIEVCYVVGILDPVVEWLAAVLIFGLRMTAMLFNLHPPQARAQFAEDQSA